MPPFPPFPESLHRRQSPSSVINKQTKKPTRPLVLYYVKQVASYTLTFLRTPKTPTTTSFLRISLSLSLSLSLSVLFLGSTVAILHRKRI